VELVAHNVWQLAGWPRDLFNVYLVGDVLIDTATRWARRRILRQIQGRALRMVALTHCHPDHQGTAKFLCEHFRVPLACHEADVPVMEGREPMQPRNWILRWGQRLWAGAPHPVERVLREGDEVAGFRVIHAPGHTPGQIMFFRDADRVVIGGDVVANINFLTRRPGLREPPPYFSFDAGQNRQSIQKLIGLKPSMVCFGHGPPLRNHEELERLAARWTSATSPPCPGSNPAPAGDAQS
jgi:glyoxylase-like metal-dependent hydrolase (beta-lactamase superfamily II)